MAELLTAAKRISHYLEALGISENEFKRRVEWSQGLLGKAVKNNSPIGSDKLERVLREFPSLNPEWLLTGRGEMTRDGIPTVKDPQGGSPGGSPDPPKAPGSVRFVPPALAAEPHADYSSGNIIMLDSKVAAGLPANYGNAEYLQDQPRISLPGHKYRGSGIIALQVEGDSMEPTIRHDDWIIARLLTDPLQELREGYLHVLVTRDGCVAKRLYRTVGKAFLCKSDNDEYPPYEQAIGPGDQVYKALALFSENLGHRRDGLLARLVAVEKGLLALQARSKKG